MRMVGTAQRWYDQARASLTPEPYMSDPTKVSTDADVKDSASDHLADARLSDAQLDAVTGGWPGPDSIPHPRTPTTTTTTDKGSGKEKPYDFTDPSSPLA
jgi:hypothetical protein